jgi:hypothetical protein
MFKTIKEWLFGPIIEFIEFKFCVYEDNDVVIMKMLCYFNNTSPWVHSRYEKVLWEDEIVI